MKKIIVLILMFVNINLQAQQINATQIKKDTTLTRTSDNKLRVDTNVIATKYYVDSVSSGGGGGTVTNVSIVSANGFAGSVATSTTTPAITLQTTITGLIKGNGTTLFAATAGTDYVTSSSTNAFTNKSGNISQWTNDAGYGLTSNPLSQFASTTSAQLISTVSDETGTGALVFGTSPTLTTASLGSSTATTQAAFDNSTKLATTAYVDRTQHESRLIQEALGSVIKAETFPAETIIQNSNLADGSIYYQAIWLPIPQTLTGVKWYQRTIGNYTADNNNVIGLYTYSGGTLTQVAVTANDGNLWQTASSNTIGSKAFSATYVANGGLHFIGILYNSSSVTTPPALGTITNFTNLNISALDFTNSAKITGTASGTNLPATQTMSGVTGNTIRFWLALY